MDTQQNVMARAHTHSRGMDCVSSIAYLPSTCGPLTKSPSLAQKRYRDGIVNFDILKSFSSSGEARKDYEYTPAGLAPLGTASSPFYAVVSQARGQSSLGCDGRRLRTCCFAIS